MRRGDIPARFVSLNAVRTKPVLLHVSIALARVLKEEHRDLLCEQRPSNYDGNVALGTQKDRVALSCQGTAAGENLGV